MSSAASPARRTNGLSSARTTITSDSAKETRRSRVQARRERSIPARMTMRAGLRRCWRSRRLEKRNVAAGFALTLQEDPYLPTDVTSFYPKRIPVLNFFTGSHDDYHRPSDTADKLDYDGLARIAKFARAIIEDVASAPERP